MSTFRHVLNTQRVGQGTLIGFRVHNNGIATYQQRRDGLSYVYCKRRVLDDGVSTVLLDLEVCPIKKEPMGEEESMEVDDTETSMEVDTPVVLDDNDRYLIHLLEITLKTKSLPCKIFRTVSIVVFFSYVFLLHCKNYHKNVFKMHR